MAVSRRSFLTRVVQGAAAAVVLAHVPIEWVPQVGGVRRYAALEYLRAEYNKASRGLGNHVPSLVVVGRDLYEAAENEMIACTYETFGHRGLFIRSGMPEGRSMMFKGAALTYRGRGWRILYMGEMDRAQFDS